MVKIQNLNIGDLVLLEYKNKFVGDVSEVIGFVYKIKPKKLELSNYNPKTTPTWSPHWNTYSENNILSYEVLKKSDIGG